MPNCTTWPVFCKCQQDLAGVGVAVLAAVQDAHIDQVAVVGLDGDGHVVLVDEQAVIRRRHRVGRAPAVTVGQVVGGRKQGEQLGERSGAMRSEAGNVHGVTSWSS